MRIQKRNSRVVADDEVIDDEIIDDDGEMMDEEQIVDVDPAATELLFETDDVAELIAEVTGEDVEVTVDDEDTGNVTFGVGDAEYEISPDEDTEVLEAVRKPLQHKRSVRASSTPRRTRRPSNDRRSNASSVRASKDVKKNASNRKARPRTKVVSSKK